MKRFFDIVISILLLVATMPIFFIVAILIKIEDGGPILFTQQRVGLNGAIFSLMKFRSMVSYASELGGYSTSENDSRITKIGKKIRRSSIDEFPQLWNVLMGEMSLVGPRPNVIEQNKLYTEADLNKRNSVLPGITGLSQATKRSNATFNERLKDDLIYVDNAGVMFDIKIIGLTIKQILFTGGN